MTKQIEEQIFDHVCEKFLASKNILRIGMDSLRDRDVPIRARRNQSGEITCE